MILQIIKIQINHLLQDKKNPKVDLKILKDCMVLNAKEHAM